MLKLESSWIRGRGFATMSFPNSFLDVKRKKEFSSNCWRVLTTVGVGWSCLVSALGYFSPAGGIDAIYISNIDVTRALSPMQMASKSACMHMISRAHVCIWYDVGKCIIKMHIQIHTYVHTHIYTMCTCYIHVIYRRCKRALASLSSCTSLSCIGLFTPPLPPPTHVSKSHVGVDRVSWMWLDVGFRFLMGYI